MADYGIVKSETGMVEFEPPETYGSEASVAKVFGKHLSPSQRIGLIWLVEKTAFHYLTYGRAPTEMDLQHHGVGDKDYPGDEFLHEHYLTEQYNLAIYWRGVRGHDDGLDLRMQLALSVLTNFADTDSLEKKLRKVGVRPLEWQAWLQYAPFNKAYAELTKKAISDAGAAVDNALLGGALQGRLDFIKYFDQKTGRFDPNKQTGVNVTEVINGLLDILSEEIKDPELLDRIASRIGVMATKMGLR